MVFRCARPASGHATATLLNRINSRRLIRDCPLAFPPRSRITDKPDRKHTSTARVRARSVHDDVAVSKSQPWAVEPRASVVIADKNARGMTPRSPTAEDRNGILMPRSPLMEDDEKLVEKVAREIVDQHGTDAVQILRERADAAELNGTCVDGPHRARDFFR